MFGAARSPRKPDLAGAVVVVTGGARGIGASTVREFAAAGARTWIGDIDQSRAADTAATIPGAQWAPLDVTDLASWREFVATVRETSGPIDVLVNNAGIMPLGPFGSENESTADLTLDINVRGLLNGIRQVAPEMTHRGRGHIVNIASMAGMLPLPGMVTYNASKFAALGASLAARREYDGTGVKVSAILPAAVRTELASGARLGGGLPTVDPEDVARAVIRSIATNPARRSVPAWVAPGWELAQVVAPESLERLIRRLVDDRRALNLDTAARRSYTDRVNHQVQTHSEGHE